MNEPRFPLNSFKLGEEGLGRALGTLELSVMQAIWHLESCSIKEAHEFLTKDRELSFNAAMTVMNRLTKKGLLSRSGKKGSYLYEAVYTQDQLSDAFAKQVTQGLVEDFGQYAMPHFLASLDDVSPETLNLIRKRLDQLEGE